MKSFDRINSDQIESTANTISGLILDEIGASGHGVANLLWKIAHYLRTRDASAGRLHDPDVHVDWHMLPGEWRQLQAVLAGELNLADSPYVQHLKASGALNG